MLFISKIRRDWNLSFREIGVPRYYHFQGPITPANFQKNGYWILMSHKITWKESQS